MAKNTTTTTTAKKKKNGRETGRIRTIARHVQGSAGTWTEPAKVLTVLDDVDVLVCGGGPAGLSAAIGAARAGGSDLRVMILERHAFLGGVITACGLETLTWYRYENTKDSACIGNEFEKRATRMGATTKFPYNDSQNLDSERFKIIADDLMRENGIETLLHTSVVDVVKRDGAIVGVIVESKSGRQVVWAKRVVDATGDADVFHLANARYTALPKKDAYGVSSVFNVIGVDKERFLAYTDEEKATYKDWSRTWPQRTDGKENHLRSPYFDKQFEDAAKAGVIESSSGIGGSWSTITDNGELRNLNMVHQKGIDALDVKQLSKAEMDGRLKTLDAIKALRFSVPGCENAKLRNFSHTLGVRHSRKIVGRTFIDEDYVMNDGRTDESIGWVPRFIDGSRTLILPTDGRGYQVPYGICVSPDVPNLLAAGRCVAGDPISHASLRNMMACCLTGQGAGVACAVSLLRNMSTSDIPVRFIQEELRRQGVKLE